MPDPSSPMSKLLVFEHSYNEVMAALKHQDDKLNRTLTALAFLTAAGVTLFLSLERISEPRDPVYFAEGGPSVTAVMFVIFLAAVTLALLTALAAIGPGTPLRFKSRSEGQTKTSLLFYAFIAADKNWSTRYHLSEEMLNSELGQNFHVEAQALAKRVGYKVARSRESGAFVQLAILALALLGIFEARGLSDSARWWIVTALVIAILLVPFWDRVQMKKYEYALGTSWGWHYAWLLIAVVLASALLVAGDAIDHHWEALYYALAVMLLSRLAFVSGGAAKVLLPLAVIGAIVPLCLMAASL